MSRQTVALLAAVLTAETYSATQTIEATPGYNFVAVELKVGENRLRELFPDAPVGTLIFTWDNHAGWSAAQMYPFGWSHPNRQILPREGMVMQLPSGVSYSPTVSGEIVPLPPPNQYIIFQGTERTAQLYSGLNLVSASLIDPRRTQRVIGFNKNTQQYISYHFDDLDNNWVPLPPREGACG